MFSHIQSFVIVLKVFGFSILILMTEKWATEQSCIHIEITSCQIPSLVVIFRKCSNNIKVTVYNFALKFWLGWSPTVPIYSAASTPRIYLRTIRGTRSVQNVSFRAREALMHRRTLVTSKKFLDCIFWLYNYYSCSRRNFRWALYHANLLLQKLNWHDEIPGIKTLYFQPLASEKF